MATFDPLMATGLVHIVTPTNETYGGTCFAFRRPDVVLTAAHCAPDDAEIWVSFPRRGRCKAIRVVKHPIADVAMIFTAADDQAEAKGFSERAFWNFVANWELGEEFLAYGYPIEGPFQGTSSPTPRLFVGHYQRFMWFEAPNNTRYLAGEMSIPAPGGLSGGPVFRRQAQPMLTGLVTSNIESYSVLNSVADIDDSGRLYKEESRRIIQYGLAVMLSKLQEWLDDLAPINS